MEKSKQYRRTKFAPEIIREAIASLSRLAYPSGSANASGATYAVEIDGATWHHDNEEEFFADYRRTTAYAHCTRHFRDPDRKEFTRSSIDVVVYSELFTRVSVDADRRDIIEAVFDVFEESAGQSQLPEPEIITSGKPTIFIGHGHSQAWRDLKDHLHEQHGYPVEAYETGARAGHAIRDILEELASKSAFALLVLTADDKLEDDTFLARRNVVHETGLFQGRLGFSRAIVMLESGVEEFSNISGIQQIRFSKGNIRETYGDVLATIKREFGDP